jgi:drug/metabolite transporter (DMT)-like permease
MTAEPASAAHRAPAQAAAQPGRTASGTPRAARHAGRAAAALLVLSIIWGYNWVIMKQAAAYAGPFQFSALRTVFATVALFALLALRRQPLGLTAWRWVLLLGLLQTGAFTALSQWALVAGAAGKTAVLAYTMPFWLLVLARIFLHERLRGWQWLAMLLAAAGLVLIVAPWRAQGSVASSALAVASGLAWAAGSVVAKLLRKRSDIGLLSLTAWQMAFGAIALVIVDLAVPAPPMHGALWLVVAVAYLAVIGTGFAWLLWMYVLDNLPAGIAGLGSLAIPAVGVIAAWLQLGERPPAHEIAGMLVVAAALGLLALAGIARGHRHPPVHVRR